MPDDPHDPLPDMIASVDQMLSVMPHVGRMYRGWFDTFKAEGFSDAQALYLSVAQMHENPGKAP